MYSSLLVDEIAKDLEQYEEAIRIKKLIFCACNDRWENNPNILQKLVLKELILTLRKANPTIEKLRDSIYQIVETLNNQEVYFAIAEIIIDKLDVIYHDSDNSTQIIFSKPEQLNITNIPELLLDKVVVNLQQNQEATRIKKLIFSLCKKVWENNSDVLANYNLKDLIKELLQLHSTLDILQQALDNLVGTLNRKSLYTLIARMITNELATLYEDNEDITEIIKENKSSEIVNNYLDYQQQYQTEEEEITISLQAKQTTKYQPQLPQPPQPQPQSNHQSQPKSRIYDPFSLRLEVMKYTNPLRAKILLFSVIYHQFDYQGKDWSILRTCSFDDLMIRLFRTHVTIQELQTKLHTTAKSLIEPSEHLAAANAIIESIKPFYNQS